MEEFLNAESLKKIKSFRKQYSTANSIQGVIRCEQTLAKVQHILDTYLFAKCYLISEEKGMDQTSHFHFVIYNNKKKLAISHFRKHAKAILEKDMIKDYKWKNGDLNISRTNDSFKILCYILKEQQLDDHRTYVTIGIESEYVKLALECSYKKISNITKQVAYLYKQVQVNLLTPQEATVIYIAFKNGLNQPDSNWTKFAQNVDILSWNKEKIQSEVEQYFEQLNMFK